MKDLISRQAVLNLLHALPPEEAITRAMLIQSVKQMSAAQPSGPDNLVKDSQGLAKDLVNDCISRQAAIDAIDRLDIPEDMCVFEILSHIELEIGTLPSAQPYTDEEIQKMQDIEQAQFDKIRELAYQDGKADAMRWIPCSEKGAEYPCLACDVFGQIFITDGGIVKINGECYDGTGFDFSNAEEFLKGIKVGNAMRMLPRKIVAWMPLPEPYKEDDHETD